MTDDANARRAAGSPSARVARQRPFYASRAETYDALITDPVQPWVDAIHGRLTAAGLSNASILDAGCGTGRHARGLLDRGHDVTLLDASADLLAVAQHRCPEAAVMIGDICAPPELGPFDAVACRGVLNDLVTDQEREAALTSFATLMRPGGILFLDVREVEAARARAGGPMARRRAVLADGTGVEFTSETTWRDGLLHAEETHQVTGSAGSPTSTEEHFEFAMRPWSRGEIETGLGRAGFLDIEVLPGVGRRTVDRLFVVARRGEVGS